MDYRWNSECRDLHLLAEDETAAKKSDNQLTLQNYLSITANDGKGDADENDNDNDNNSSCSSVEFSIEF